MTRILLISILILLNVACAKDQNPYPCYEPLHVNTAKPDVLVIGDSISIGYIERMAQELSTYELIHNPCNAQNTRKTKLLVDSWLNLRPQWEAITFNNGIWDTADFALISIPEYSENLRQIARKVKARTARPLFILTTPIPPGTMYFDDARVQAYNAAAAQVMAEEGIPVLDLYTFGTTISGLQNVQDVHWSYAGYQALGLEVSNRLHVMGL